MTITQVSSKSSVKTVPVPVVLFPGSPCCGRWFCHHPLLNFTIESQNEQLLFNLDLGPEPDLCFFPFFSQMGSGQAGAGMGVGRVRSSAVQSFSAGLGGLCAMGFLLRRILSSCRKNEFSPADLMVLNGRIHCSPVFLTIIS